MASSISIQSPMLARPTRTPVLFSQNALRKDNRIRKLPAAKRKISGTCSAVSEQGPAAAYAKDMERLDAKESLLLALKDAGGFEALLSGKTTKTQYIDINERIVNLERLNPTPRPTGFTLSVRLSVEGPLRVKEEYVEGIFETLKVDEHSIPEQLRGAFDFAASRLQQLPGPITDALAGGLKVPLGGTYERLFMISYLDDEILIVRDPYGSPEVLSKSESGPSTAVVEIEEPIPEYQS